MYDTLNGQVHWHIMRWIMKWENEHSRNKRWVTMKNKGANNEECADNHDVRLMYMMRAISNEPK